MPVSSVLTNRPRTSRHHRFAPAAVWREKTTLRSFVWSRARDTLLRRRSHGVATKRGEMLGMGQQRRSVIGNQHRPVFDQPFQVGIKPANLQRRCSATNG